ncbi:hypothetical protein Tco_1085931 [Tanacetum coccineum]
MEMSRVPYASAVRSLMFAMICTRPDIAHAVGVVSRYMAEPGRGHWEALKRILRYIKGTSDVALCYEESGLTVKGYVDSDYAGDLDGSKSTTGYVFTLSGGIVSWVSKLQSVMAMSTTEAEYVAAAQASKEAIVIVAMAAKFEIEKFNGNNLSLWKLKMKAILRKDKCLAAIGERPAEVTDDSKWDEIDENAIACLVIILP